MYMTEQSPEAPREHLEDPMQIGEGFADIFRPLAEGDRWGFERAFVNVLDEYNELMALGTNITAAQERKLIQTQEVLLILQRINGPVSRDEPLPKTEA